VSTNLLGVHLIMPRPDAERFMIYLNPCSMHLILIRSAPYLQLSETGIAFAARFCRIRTRSGMPRHRLPQKHLFEEPGKRWKR